MFFGYPSYDQNPAETTKIEGSSKCFSNLKVVSVDVEITPHRLAISYPTVLTSLVNNYSTKLKE